MGVSLRILLLVDGMSVAAALYKANDFHDVWRVLIEISLLVQPLLLASLLILCAGSRWFSRLSYLSGILVILCLELFLVTLVYRVGREVFDLDGVFQLGRLWFFSLAVSGVLLAYFYLRERALSPALGEARLQALQARIRPHFLFNSINAVLSMIRSDPKRAETALEDLADLFRVLMADNRELVRLEQEVALSRQYLNLEQLRLGDRLHVVWHIENMPQDALIPPLVLQPLLENAVYHGIEPSSERGEICVNIYRIRSQVHIVIRNPYRREGAHHLGNKMAVGNIRERLALHFDAEASLTAQIGENDYKVHIVIPYKLTEPT
ncbi:MAG: histidine kinase [Sulfuricellaceae bacterium]|nr:histidine kinase [Sulfuricellaceae bacterium]